MGERAGPLRFEPASRLGGDRSRSGLCLPASHRRGSRKLVPPFGPQSRTETWSITAATRSNRAMMGFLFAVIIGVPLGAVMARLPLFEAVFEPLFSFSYPVPKIALYPFSSSSSGSAAARRSCWCSSNASIRSRSTAISGSAASPPPLCFAQRRIWEQAVRGPCSGRWQSRAAPDISAGIRIALPLAFIVVILAGNYRGECRIGLLHLL